MLAGMWRKGIMCALLGNVNCIATWKTPKRYPKKLKTKLSYDPTIPLLGIDSKETKSASQRDICTPTHTAVLFTIPKAT